MLNFSYSAAYRRLQAPSKKVTSSIESNEFMNAINGAVTYADFVAKLTGSTNVDKDPMLKCTDGNRPQFDSRFEKPVVGVIGDQSSDITIQVRESPTYKNISNNQLHRIDWNVGNELAADFQNPAHQLPVDVADVVRSREIFLLLPDGAQ